MQINCDGVPPTGRIALEGSFGLNRRRSATSTVAAHPMSTIGLSTPVSSSAPGVTDLAPFAALNADPRVTEHFPQHPRPCRQRRAAIHSGGTCSIGFAEASLLL